MSSAFPNPVAWLRGRFLGHLGSETPSTSGARLEIRVGERERGRRRRRTRAGALFASASLAAREDAAASAAAAATASTNGFVSREELGRATWLLLHTIAAEYPDEPTRAQRRDAREFLRTMTSLYPCERCGAEFADITRRDAPDVSSGDALRAWTCRAHNEVNAKLGKPAFACERFHERWRGVRCDDGDDGCDVDAKRARRRGRGGSERGGRLDTF